MDAESRRRINRENAQKSTGPKTTEGKQKARRNALKHGLSGDGTVMRRSDERKLAKRIADWRETLAPINPLEDTLVERAALAAVRCESAVKQEGAARRRRLQQAVCRHQAGKRRKTSKLAKQLESQPRLAIRELGQTPDGRAWLIAQWEQLAERLEMQGFWLPCEAALAVRLLGKDPSMPYPDDANLAALRRTIVAVQPELDVDEAEAFLGIEKREGTDDASRHAAINALLPEPAVAREALRGIVADALAGLRGLQEEHAERDERQAAREHAELVALHQIGTDLESTRLYRYEMQAELSLHRNLQGLIRIRKQEPDMASIARWEKQGKQYNRRWDGYCWVPNAEWRLEEGVVGEAWGAGREDQELKVAESSPVSGPSLRSDPGTRNEPVLSAEEAPRRVPGAESKTMPRLPSVEADEPRAGVCSDEQPSLWVPGVERSDPPDTVIRSEQAPSRGQDQEPPGDGPSLASGGSLSSTPGTRPGGSLEGREEPGPAGDEPATAAGASADAGAPATPSGAVGEEGQKPGLPGDGHMMVSGSSLRSDPGTRFEGDPKTGSQSQATARVAGFSALREPGASQPKREPAEKKTMTDGGWLTTEQTTRTNGQPEPAEQAADSERVPVSHPSSAISHSPPSSQVALRNEASGIGANVDSPSSSANTSICFSELSRPHPREPGSGSTPARSPA